MAVVVAAGAQAGGGDLGERTRACHHAASSLYARGRRRERAQQTAGDLRVRRISNQICLAAYQINPSGSISAARCSESAPKAASLSSQLLPRARPIVFAQDPAQERVVTEAAARRKRSQRGRRDVCVRHRAHRATGAEHADRDDLLYKTHLTIGLRFVRHTSGILQQPLLAFTRRLFTSEIPFLRQQSTKRAARLGDSPRLHPTPAAGSI